MLYLPVSFTTTELPLHLLAHVNSSCAGRRPIVPWHVADGVRESSVSYLEDLIANHSAAYEAVIRARPHTVFPRSFDPSGSTPHSRTVW